MLAGNVPLHSDSHQKERVSRRFLPLLRLLLLYRCAPANTAVPLRISPLQRAVISHSAPSAIVPLQQLPAEVRRTQTVRVEFFWLEIYTWWESCNNWSVLS